MMNNRNETINVEVDGIPFISTGKYYSDDRQELCHKLKDGDTDAIAEAAKRMFHLIPRNGVLVPIPNRCGYARETLVLARTISKISFLPVADVLRGNVRESQYFAKKAGHSLSEADLGFHQVSPLPAFRKPIFIDGVADTGLSAKAAFNAVGRGMVVTLAVTDNLLEQGREMHIDRGMKR